MAVLLRPTLARVPRQPRRPRELQWQVFRGSDALRSGILTARQLRSTAWRRLRYDVYADSRLEPDHALACYAALARLPADAVIAGPSAAFLDGVPHAAGFRDDVHVIVPAKAPALRQQGVRFHAVDLLPEEITRIGGPAQTTAARTSWDLAQWLDVVAAVTVIDGLLGMGLVTAGQLAEFAAARRGRRGGRRAARTFGLADGRAQSPPESQLRVRFVLAGLPRPEAQHPVTLPSGLTLHPDLAWPEFKVAVEYDGAWHGEPDRLDLDRRRLNKLVGAGWLVVHVTSQGLRRDFAGVLRDVCEALRSRGWRP